MIYNIVIRSKEIFLFKSTKFHYFFNVLLHNILNKFHDGANWLVGLENYLETDAVFFEHVAVHFELLFLLVCKYIYIFEWIKK